MDEISVTLMGSFKDAQQRQLWHWLLNPQMYAVVAGLLLASAWVPVTRWRARCAVSVTHDFIYGVFHTLVTFPLLAVSVLIITAAVDAWLPWLNLHLYGYLPAWAQVLLAIVVTDALKFFIHVLHHKLRWLWYFHTIHHSQQELNPFTTKRVHLGERLASLWLVSWIPLVVMGSPPEVWLAYYLVDAVWDYFIHSNLNISLGILKYVVVSPRYHRLHHSIEVRHFDQNFADRFVIWDVLCGTANFDFSEPHATGVANVSLRHESSLHPARLLWAFAAQFAYPFRMIARDIGRVRQRRDKREARLQ